MITIDQDRFDFLMYAYFVVGVQFKLRDGVAI